MTNDDLAAQLLAYMERQDAFVAMLAAWASGVAGGGPQSDGRYPLPTGPGTTTLVACPAQNRADATGLRTVQVLNQAAFTLDASLAGALIRVNSASTTALTIANTVPVGWSCLVLRENTGAVTFAAAGGAVLVQDQSWDRLRARYSIAMLVCTSRGSGTPTINLSGALTDSSGT